MAEWMGVEIVTENIDRIIAEAKVIVTANVRNASSFLKDKVGENISLTDHSLDDLAAMGHPYARRAPNPPHTPSWLIHKQSGQLVKSLQYRTGESGGDFVGRVGFDEDIAPHAAAVILGTSKMIGRDVLSNTATLNKDELIQILTKDLQGTF